MLIDPNIPLIDLHRHLDGSVRLETILDLGIKHQLPLPAKDLEALRPFVQVVEPKPSIMDFIAKFEWMVGVLADYDACYRVAYENVEDARAEGIDYIELRFSPWFMAEPHQLKPEGVVEAVIDGVSAATSVMGIKVNLIGILSRTYGPEIAHNELAALLTQKKRITALDLAGDEARFPAELFIPHFKKARDAGWRITVHAGEADGAESIWNAIKLLGAERIGHAVRAFDDPVLIEFMRERGIGVESNLTSNVQTTTVPDYRSHPLKRFLEEGVLATINTDDPGISGMDLSYEYEMAHKEAGLTLDQLHQAQRNALEIAFLSDEDKNDLQIG
jgi:adenosine deaminase